MAKRLIFLIPVILLLLAPLSAGARNPYPPPQPTWQATPVPPEDLIPEIPLQPAEFCERRPPETNVCGWGLFTVERGLTRWYVTKDGPFDPEPLYVFCVTWTDPRGTRDMCIDLRIHSYHARIGVDGSGRNLYVSDQWLRCGRGFINILFMSTISGQSVEGEIRQPNFYNTGCWFIPVLFQV